MFYWMTHILAQTYSMQSNNGKKYEPEVCKNFSSYIHSMGIKTQAINLSFLQSNLKFPFQFSHSYFLSFLLCLTQSHIFINSIHRDTALIFSPLNIFLSDKMSWLQKLKC